MRWLFLILFSLFLVGCGKSEKQLRQEKVVQEAVGALKKVNAATEVGVNYQQYGLLLIDAKTKVNDAVGVSEDESLKTQLKDVMQAYQDAATLWQMKIDKPAYDKKLKVKETDETGKVANYFFDGARTVKDVADKYQLRITENGSGSIYSGSNLNGNAAPGGKYLKTTYSYVDLDANPMQYCWAWSSQKLNAMDEAINQK